MDRFVGRLFDKDAMTVRPASVQMPYCSENLPPEVRTIVFSVLYLIHN
jgi:hypothetical protein